MKLQNLLVDEIYSFLGEIRVERFLKEMKLNIQKI